MTRLPFLTVVVVVVACATTAPVTHTAPPWAAGPQPRVTAGERCYVGESRDAPDADTAVELARQRGLAAIVTDAGAHVESLHLAFQAEEDGRLRVSASETVATSSATDIWGVYERRREQRSSQSGASVWLELCVPDETFAAMRRGLTATDAEVLTEARNALARARGALDSGALDIVGAPIAAVRRSLEEHPDALAPVREELATLEGRLARGLLAVIESPPAAEVRAGAAAEATLHVRMVFEEHPVSSLAWRCEGAPCRVDGATKIPNTVQVHIGPLETWGREEVKLTIAMAGAGDETTPSTDLRLPVVVSPRSVLLCPDSPTASSLRAELATRKLDVVPVALCEYDKPERIAAARVTVEESFECRERFGDQECTARMVATLSNPATGTDVAAVRTARTFVHPERDEARAGARRQALAILLSRTTARVAQFVRRKR